MARVVTNVGDIFSVKIENKKKYFQYISNDLTQLNSNVIRAFVTTYELNDNPDFSDLVNDEIAFYAHCVTKLGVKMALWGKVGNIKEVGKFDNILFNGTNDYGRKTGEEPIKVSEKWYVWKIGDKNFTKVGKLKDGYEKSYVGLVINPYGIIELLKGNKYPINYPI